MNATLLYKSDCILGEGPRWHRRRKSFFWVDIIGQLLYEYNWHTQKLTTWQLPHKASLVIEQENENEVMLAMQGGIADFNLTTGSLHWLLDIEKEIPGNRTNDGAIDAQGRIWVGTMDVRCVAGAGNLYCIEKNYNLHKKLEQLSIPNGIAWTPDNKTMYHTETAANEIRSYKYDIDTGHIEFEKISIKVPGNMGSPDGMCMDEKGMLWVAHWGGYGVYCWNPLNGKLLNSIEVPAKQVTACTFGGNDLSTLFITTARENLTAEELAIFPLSGSVFTATPGVKGMQ